MGDTAPAGGWQPTEDESQRQHLDALIDALPGGVLVRDLDGRVVFINQWLPNYMGLGLDEVTGSTIGELYQLLDEHGVELEPEAYPSARAVRGETFDSVVVGVPGPGGEIRWVATSGRPVRDEQGRVTGGLIVFLDTSEHVRVRDQLARHEALLREAERISGVGSWSRDISSGDTEVSEQLRRLMGLMPDEPVSREALYEFVHPDDRARLFEGTYRAFVEGAPFSAQLRATSRTGIERRVEVQAERYARADGVPAGLVGTVRDLTLDEQLARADRLEIVGRLAGGLAHDFNNLLTVVTGHAELLRSSASPLQLESIDAILAASQRAQHTTHQLLEFGRREMLQPRSVDVADLLTQLHEIARSVVPASIDLRVVTGPGTPPAHVDPQKLEQVLLNLVLNARDALDDAGAITVRTGAVDVDGDLPLPPGRYVEILVVDDGPGMDAEVLSHALEPFFTTKGLGEGSGLGLATSHGLIAQSGGLLSLTSAPGRGTTARVLLPVSDTAPQHLGGPTASTTGQPASGPEQVTILLAEDDDQLRPLVQRLLESTGHRVLVGNDGADAFMVAAESGQRIDLLVTDVTMPHRNGHELAVSLGAVHPELRVIFMSGYTEHAAVAKGIADRNINFLPKPFSPKELLDLVDAVLKSGNGD